jgi:hypothetical protein
MLSPESMVPDGGGTISILFAAGDQEQREAPRKPCLLDREHLGTLAGHEAPRDLVGGYRGHTLVRLDRVHVVAVLHPGGALRGPNGRS